MMRSGARLRKRHRRTSTERATGGKVFLTLIATGWERDHLHFRLEAGFSEIKDRYFFEGTVDPLHLKTIADWKVSKTKS